VAEEDGAIIFLASSIRMRRYISYCRISVHNQRSQCILDTYQRNKISITITVVDEGMGGWMDGWMVGWTEGQTDRQTDRQIGKITFHAFT
jgi:hypothetical protein